MASVIISAGLSVADAEASSKKACLKMNVRKDGKIEIYSRNPYAVERWFKELNSDVSSEFIIHKIQPCFKITSMTALDSIKPANEDDPPSVAYIAKELGQIYGFPAPDPSVNIVVGVVSFGGGLFGSVDAEGLLTSGDVIDYWTQIVGIPYNEQPRVIIKPINGATNSPDNGSATMENTLDVEAIGGACPSPNLTIILYIAPNDSGFYPILNYMYNTPVVVGGVSYSPDIISISWCIPELYTSDVSNSALNSLFTNITAAGISIFVATGDWGAPNSRDWGGGDTGPPGNDINYPASHPSCTAVGGTTLVCQNFIYDSSTVETAWADSGGGTSEIYSKPSYQSRISGQFRSIPDLSAVADPNTGMILLLDGQTYVIGGTSLSAPLMAAFLACINCRKYINPLIYSAPSNCFYDITSGDIGGGVVTGPGYDKCTGRGTINGANFAPYLNGIQVTGVTLNQSTGTLKVGNTLQLIETVGPTNATFKSVVWSSSNNSHATVSTNGLVTAVSSGLAIITVTTDDGKFVASCALNIGLDVDVNVSGVTLNQSTASLNIGSSLQLTATVAPTNATIKTLVWSSSNTSHATVSSNGLVTGVSRGLATITVITNDGSFEASCAVNIGSFVSVTGVRLSLTYTTLTIGYTLQLRATVFPPNATNKQLTWSSSSPCASLNGPPGQVFGESQGTAIITATSVDGSKTATCTVVVYPVTITMSQVSTTCIVGKITNIDATVAVPGGNVSSIYWHINNERRAIVPRFGRLISSTPSTVRIQIGILGRSDTTYPISLFTYYYDSISVVSGICSVRVITQVESILLNVDNIRLQNGNTFQAIPIIYPSTVTNKNISWSSSSNEIATVNANGLITAVSTGTATITVTTEDGNKNNSLRATILPQATTPVESVLLNVGNIRLENGNTYQAIPTIYPSTATNKDVSWSSSSNSIATVDENGVITAVSTGTATITVTTEDGNKKNSLTVSILPPATTPVQSVLLNLGNVRIQTGNTYQAIPIIYPSTATNKNVSWSSSSNSIATVDVNGLISAVSTGTAIITVTTVDGNKKNSLTASILPQVTTTPVKSVLLNVDNISLENGNTYQAIPIIYPSTATYKDVSWSSSANSIATVGSNGLITAVSTGTALITVTTGDGNKKNSLKASIINQVRRIHINQNGTLNNNQELFNDIFINIGTTTALTLTILPTNASNFSIIWSSLNTRVATVSTSGVVTAVSLGEAIIRVSTADRVIGTFCRIRVQ